MTKAMFLLFMAIAVIGCKPDEETPELFTPVYFHIECDAKINSGSIWMNDQKIDISDTGTYAIQEPKATKYIYIQYSFLSSPGNQDVTVTIYTPKWSMERHHLSNTGKSNIESFSLN